MPSPSGRGLFGGGLPTSPTESCMLQAPRLKLHKSSVSGGGLVSHSRVDWQGSGDKRTKEAIAGLMGNDSCGFGSVNRLSSSATNGLHSVTHTAGTFQRRSQHSRLGGLANVNQNTEEEE